jgi:hypothetical protein
MDTGQYVFLSPTALNSRHTMLTDMSMQNLHDNMHLFHFSSTVSMSSKKLSESTHTCQNYKLLVMVT